MRRVVLSFALLAAGCGIKAFPLAPGDVRLKAPRAFSARGADGALLLSWRAPEAYEDGEPPEGLARFRLLIQAEQDERPVTLATVPAAEGGLYSFREDRLLPGNYLFWALAVDEDGFEGEPAGPLSFYWRTPPRPPEIAPQPEDRYVIFHRELPVDGVATPWNLYLVEEDGAERRLNPEPIVANAYMAYRLTNGRTYRFRARGVIPRNGSEIEGPPSETIDAVPEDRTPPAAPEDVIAAQEPEGVLLRWSPNVVDDDLVGYYVYAREGRDWLRLTEAPVPGPTYLDPGAVRRPDRGT
ncbi:MAG: hypothetical protein K8I02_03165, partial [Candidatus Methylomirabilis sp.]|nr:hypothetical protein [Deltaproteobacteria bacterium]